MRRKKNETKTSDAETLDSTSRSVLTPLSLIVIHTAIHCFIRFNCQ